MNIQSSQASGSISIKLPSCGIPYEGGLPEAVNIMPMTGEDEAVLASESLNVIEKTSRILRSCCPQVGKYGPEKLLAADRVYLLLCIRAHSLTEKYLLSKKCDVCKTTFDTEVDIYKDLTVHTMPRKHMEVIDGKDVEVEYAYSPTEQIKVTLRSGARLKIHLLTGREESLIAKELESKTSPYIPNSLRNNPNAAAKFLQRAMMVTSITTGGGEVPETTQEVDNGNPAAIMALVTTLCKMPMRDLLLIDTAYQKYDIGFSPIVMKKCPACSEEVPVNFALTTEFFRPSNLE